MVSASENTPGSPDHENKNLKTSGLSEFEKFSEDLKKKTEHYAPPQDDPQSRQDHAIAVRVCSEFVAAILVGCALGIGIDWLFGSSPFGLIVLACFGLVAGIFNIKRLMD